MLCILLGVSLIILNTAYLCLASVEAECFSSYSTQPSQCHHSPFPLSSVPAVQLQRTPGAPNAFS